MPLQSPILRLIYTPGIYANSLRVGVVAAHFEHITSIVLNVGSQTVARWSATGGIDGVEHYATIDLSQIASGKYNLWCVATSKQGTERKIEAPIWVGESAANKEWTIVEDQVIGDKWAGPENRWQKTRHLLLRRCTITTPIRAGTLGGQIIALEGCTINGCGAWDTAKMWAGRYAVGCRSTGATNPFTRADLALRCIATEVSSDAFQGPRMVVDCLVANVVRRDPKLHPDVVQWHEDGDTENRVILRLTAITNIKAMGIGGRGVKDILIKDCAISNRGWDGAAFSLADPCAHVIVMGSTFAGSCLWRVDQGFTAEDVHCINSSFDGKPSPSAMLGKGQTAPTGVTIR